MPVLQAMYLVTVMYHNGVKTGLKGPVLLRAHDDR